MSDDEWVELRQLTYFDAVVTHGGFGRAAQHLRVAQPAISVQVRKLERELGVTLLDRTTRKVELTRAGKQFLRRARAVIAELSAVPTDLALLGDGEIGRVRIGAIQALGPFDLAGALAAFHHRYPAVELELRPGRVAQLLADLDDDRIDLAIGPVPADLPDRFDHDHLFTDELVVITARDHPTATAGPLPLTAVRDEPFVSLPAGSGLRAILDRLAAEAGFVPTVPFESSSLTRMRDLVAHGLGVAVVARSIAEAPGLPVAVHPIDPGPVWRPVGLIRTTRPQAPAAAACREFLLARGDEPPPGVPRRPRVAVPPRAG